MAIVMISVSVTPLAALNPNKVGTSDCSECHGTLGTYDDSIMDISISNNILAPGEEYIVSVDIVMLDIQRNGTGCAVQDLSTGDWVAMSGRHHMTHYDLLMVAPMTASEYAFRVWGASGPPNEEGKTDFDDYSIIVEGEVPPPPTEIHDISIKSLKAPKQTRNGSEKSVTVTVKNLGTQDEYVQLMIMVGEAIYSNDFMIVPGNGGERTVIHYIFGELGPVAAFALVSFVDLSIVDIDPGNNLAYATTLVK